MAGSRNIHKQLNTTAVNANVHSSLVTPNSFKMKPALRGHAIEGGGFVFELVVVAMATTQSTPADCYACRFAHDGLAPVTRRSLPDMIV